MFFFVLYLHGTSIHWAFKSFLNMLRSFLYEYLFPIPSKGSSNKKNLPFFYSKALLDPVIEFFVRSHPISCLFGPTPGYCLHVYLEEAFNELKYITTCGDLDFSFHLVEAKWGILGKLLIDLNTFELSNLKL